MDLGRLANGYFVNGHFELQCAEAKHYFQRMAGRLFRQRGPTSFVPFSSFVAALKALFTDSQSTRLQSAHLQSARLRADEILTEIDGGISRGRDGN